jgi:hypothetical protein
MRFPGSTGNVCCFPGGISTLIKFAFISVMITVGDIAQVAGIVEDMNVNARGCYDPATTKPAECIEILQTGALNTLAQPVITHEFSEDQFGFRISPELLLCSHSL